MLLELIEITRIVDAIRQADIQRRAHLARRIITLAMHRKCEYRFVTLENRCSTVALMYVEIDNERTAQQALMLQTTNGDRHIVQNTEALAMIGESVMGPAGQITRSPICEGSPGCEQRTLHRKA